jgi:general secretion pathway protein E
MNADHPDAALVLSDELIAAARERARTNGRRVIDELEAGTGQPVRRVLAAVAQRLGLRVIESIEMSRCTPAFDRLPLVRALERTAVLLRPPGETRVLAVTPDAFDLDLATWLEAQAGSGAEVVLALRSDIQAYLTQQEAAARAVQTILQDTGNALSARAVAEELTFSSATQDHSAAVKVVNSTLYDALKSDASDVHLEATAEGLTVRYRIDGLLDEVATIKGNDLSEQIISRLKVLAELDIAERRVPQDGSFRVSRGGRDIDLRVSVMPSVHGEDAVIRILDKQRMVEATGRLTLDVLGFDKRALKTVRGLLEQPYGMLLVTGPTGSGKTTTLYAALAEINTGRDKIITIEDPVEYQIPGILQIPVNDKKGLTFARGLRSILRHDPDKIMVGEIRDRETAEIAVQASLTGHLVLTTVHANNVFDVFSRFTHMNIDPYGFASALNGIWAQRLVRIVCQHCGTEHAATHEERETLGPEYLDASDLVLRRGAGCGDCRGTGYRGRKAIAEILRLTEEIREMIVDRKPARVIRAAARADGTRTLREACIDLVLAGETTVEELKRVTLHA